jgi:Ca-activated chloride channel family protein
MMRRRRWLGWCLLLVGAAGPSTHVAEGNRKYTAGDLAGALSDYTAAQIDDPDSPGVRYNLGNVLFRQGEFARAAEEYRQALTSADPELRARARFNLGNARFMAKEYQQAADEFVGVLKERPEDADAKRNLELALAALRKPPPEKSPNQKPSEDKKDQKDQEGEKQNPSSEGQPPPQPPEDSQSKDGSKGKSPSEAKPQPQGDASPRPGEAGEQPATPAGTPQSITAQEAARLLDALKDQEKQNLKKALRAGRRSRGTGKDW